MIEWRWCNAEARVPPTVILEAEGRLYLGAVDALLSREWMELADVLFSTIAVWASGG